MEDNIREAVGFLGAHASEYFYQLILYLIKTLNASDDIYYYIEEVDITIYT